MVDNINIDFINELIKLNDTTEGSLFYNGNHEGCNAQLSFIYYVINKIKPKSIIEIGTHQALFDYYILTICNSIVKITTFDINPQSLFCVQKVNDYFNSDKVDFIFGNSIKTFENYTQSADLIWIDGGHKYETCLFDLKNAHRLKISNIMVDDYRDKNDDCVKKAVEYFVKNGYYEYIAESNLIDDRGIVYLRLLQ